MATYRIELAETDPGAVVGRQPGYVFEIVNGQEQFVGDSPMAAVQLNDPYRRERFCTLTAGEDGLRILCHSQGRGAWLVAAAGPDPALRQILIGLRARHLDTSVLDRSAASERTRWVRGTQLVLAMPERIFARIAHPQSVQACVEQQAVLLLAGAQLRIWRLASMPPPPAYGAPHGPSPIAHRWAATSPPATPSALLDGLYRAPHDRSPLFARAVPSVSQEQASLGRTSTVHELAGALGGALLLRTDAELRLLDGALPEGSWLGPAGVADVGALALDLFVGGLARLMGGRATELPLVLCHLATGPVEPFALLATPVGEAGSLVVVYPLLPRSGSPRGSAFGDQVWSRFADLASAPGGASEIEPIGAPTLVPGPPHEIVRSATPPAAPDLDFVSDVTKPDGGLAALHWALAEDEAKAVEADATSYEQDDEPSIIPPPTQSASRWALGRELLGFLERLAPVDSPRATSMLRQLRANPREIPLELPLVLYEAAAAHGDQTEEDAYQVLGRLRRALTRVAGRDRALIAACLEGQRRLTDWGFERLLDEVDSGREIERLLLLRTLLLRPPKPTEPPRTERWMGRAAWRLAGDTPKLVSKVVVEIDSLLHDFVKHELRRLDDALSKHVPSAARQVTDGEQRRLVGELIEELLERLRGLDQRLRPAATLPGAATGTGLFFEEMDELGRLARAGAWGPVETTAFEATVQQVRRVCVELVARLRVSVPDVVERIVGRFQGDSVRGLKDLGEAADVTVEVSYDAARRTSLTLVAERAALHTVVVNLVSNAISSARGTAGLRPVRVRVGVGLAGDPRQPRLELRVEDSGRGVAPGDLARIWSASQGLRLVQEQIVPLGGEVAVEPSAFGGAAFVVTFPRIIA